MLEFLLSLHLNEFSPKLIVVYAVWENLNRESFEDFQTIWIDEIVELETNNINF